MAMWTRFWKAAGYNIGIVGYGWMNGERKVLGPVAEDRICAGCDEPAVEAGVVEGQSDRPSFALAGVELRRAMTIVDRIDVSVPEWTFEILAAVSILKVVEDCCAFVDLKTTLWRY